MNLTQRSYRRSAYQKIDKHPDAVNTQQPEPETLRAPDGIPLRKNMKQGTKAAAQFVGKIAKSTVQGAGLGAFLFTREGMREGLHIGRRAGRKLKISPPANLWQVWRMMGSEFHPAWRWGLHVFRLELQSERGMAPITLSNHPAVMISPSRISS